MQRRSGGADADAAEPPCGQPAEAQDTWKDVRTAAHSARRSPLRWLLFGGLFFLGMFLLLAVNLHGALPGAVPNSLRGRMPAGPPAALGPATPAYAERSEEEEVQPEPKRTEVEGRELPRVSPGSSVRAPPDKPENPPDEPKEQFPSDEFMEPAKLAAVPNEPAGAVRGVAADLQARYASHQESGTFECFDGSGTFDSFAAVNDDYCECLDGSDEPGTSACSGIHGTINARFSCNWAGDSDDEHTLRLAAVNDGICDCCGGEDEWDGVTVCRNRCAEVKAAEGVEASKHLAGSRAREAFAAKTAKLAKKAKFEDVDGGPDGVFLAAAEEGCITKDDGDFEFKVCLFDRVEQKDKRSGGGYKIGKGGAWSTTLWEDGKTHRKDYSKLIMDDGEFCPPARAPRRAEINFECGDTQSVVKIAEAQVCVYAITFRTPAACRPLKDHHDHHD